MKLSRTLLSAAALALSVAAPAFAQTVVYTFTNGGSAFATPGNYGTVTLTQDGSFVDFSVLLAPEFNFVTTGNANSKAVFSFNASGVSVGDIGSIVAAGGGTFAAAAPAANSPFGSFNFGIFCTSCANGAPGQQQDPLTFKVASSVLTDFQFLSTGGIAAFFAADLISGSTTGAVGAPGVPVTPVPEPGTYALMLAGLGVMGFMANRRRKQQA